jgi:hypothetical protein
MVSHKNDAVYLSQGGIGLFFAKFYLLENDEDGLQFISK